MRPALEIVDWTLIALYAVFALLIGSFFTREASRGVQSFFVGDRRLPWWVAGTSIVATTFAADTPLAVTGIVATRGISGNWLWWSWAVAHLSATFLFARMWRRSGVITDAEITELRYGGRPAAMLRGFKAIYFGVFINCLTMAWVIAAMVKISRAFFDVEPWIVIAACVALSVAYTTLGGFRSVVVTDLVQFALGMGGAVVLAALVVLHFGGIGTAEPPEAAAGSSSGLLGSLALTMQRAGRDVDDVLDFVPSADNPSMPLVAFLVLLGVGWWRYAEGNGYLVQRLAAAKDEAHAQGASLWFAIAHNALRPWPWILVALAALVVYPPLPEAATEVLSSGAGENEIIVSPATLDVALGGELRVQGAPPDATVQIGSQSAPLELRDGELVAELGPFAEQGSHTVRILASDGRLLAEIEGLSVRLTDREMAYPLMMGRFLPPGLLGLVVASLLAAFMSTVDTHTNWGASYLVQDVYRRFLRPEAGDRECVFVSRGCVVMMALLAGLAALIVQNIAEVWRFLITLGAGLGSVSAIRWYWWRVTPHAEFAALAVTTVLALGLQLLFTESLFGSTNPFFLFEIPGWTQILIIAGASLATWVPVCIWGPQNDKESLQRFAAKVQPPGPGWRPYREHAEPLWPALLRVGVGMVTVYGALFGIGRLILGEPWTGLFWLAAASVTLVYLVRSATKPHGQLMRV